MSPLISVIIPTYNRPDLLVNRCLPSVFGQTVNDQEVLVIGDGTDEQTVQAMAGDSRIRFWNLPHYPYPDDHNLSWGMVGLASLNWGLEHAQGEWIAVIADDDEWLPHHNEVLLNAASRSGAQHVYGIAETYKHGKPINQTYGSWPPGDAAFCNGANIYRRDLDYRYDLECTYKGRTGDADLWTRMYADGVKFHFEKTVVLRYHRNWP